MILFLHPGYPGEMRFSGNISPLSHRDVERGPLRSSCMTLVLHFARISNVDSVMFVNGITKMVRFEPVKEIEKDVFRLVTSVRQRYMESVMWLSGEASECGIRALPSSLSFILFLSSVVQIRLLEILSLLILLTTTSTTTVSTSTKGYKYSLILLLFILLLLRPLSSLRLLLLLFALIKFSD